MVDSANIIIEDVGVAIFLPHGAEFGRAERQVKVVLRKRQRWSGAEMFAGAVFSMTVCSSKDTVCCLSSSITTHGHINIIIKYEKELIIIIDNEEKTKRSYTFEEFIALDDPVVDEDKIIKKPYAYPE